MIDLANKLIDYNPKRIPQTALLTSAKEEEGHVEHILNKLGFDSRAQIAVWFHEAERTVDGDQAPGDPP